MTDSEDAKSNKLKDNINCETNSSIKNDKHTEQDVEEWDKLYDDSGESILKKFEKLDIKSNKKNEEVNEDEKEANRNEITTNKIDYLKFKPKELKENLSGEEEETYGPEYSYILEIYDFPKTFKNENILNAFQDAIGNQDLSLKWVDDTHCLGVFSSTEQANRALKIENALLKVRPISQASQETKKLAKRKIDYLRPYKPRPQTSSLVATNLISASLGMRNLMSKEKIAMERKKLASARDKISKDKDLKDQIWNGETK